MKKLQIVFKPNYERGPHTLVVLQVHTKATKDRVLGQWWFEYIKILLLQWDQGQSSDDSNHKEPCTVGNKPSL